MRTLQQIQRDESVGYHIASKIQAAESLEQTQARSETRPSEVRSDALLGCPFCGYDAVMEKMGKFYFVKCSCRNGGCHPGICTRLCNTEAEARKVWNRRQPNDSNERQL